MMPLAVYILVFLLAGAFGAVAQVRETVTVQSRTGQFAVQSVHTWDAPSSNRSTPAPLRTPAGEGWFFLLRPGQIKPQRDVAQDIRVTLTPAIGAVVCEQIKEALLREFGIVDGWRHKIQVQLDSDLREDDIAISARPHPRGWMYVVEIPVAVRESTLVRAAVIALLYEMAHRQYEGASVELPPWLVEGLVAHLRSTGLSTLVPQAGQPINRVQVQGSSVARVQERLKREAALTFDELSWPDQLPAERAALFRESAHLFVHELLKLRDGGLALSEFINELAAYHNWQFAFLKAFSGEFSHLRDVEKWWGLALVNFTGRGPSQARSLEDALRALDDALVHPVEVRVAAHEVPGRRVLSLREILEEDWEPARHRTVVQRSVMQLRVLQSRASAEIFPLVDQYRLVLERYLQPGFQAQGGSPRRGQPATNMNALRQSTIRQLNDLDRQRLSLRSELAGH